MSGSVTSARRFVDRLLRRGSSFPEVPPDCIVAHRDSVTRAARTLGGVTIDIGGQRPQLLSFLRPEHGRPFAVVDGCVGAPAAAALVEELAEYGFRRLWCVGAAGHPARRLPAPLDVGDLIVASEAASYEGTSRHYAPGETLFRADAAMTAALEQAVRGLGVRSVLGRAATTDAIYRETPAFLDQVLDAGAVALDMESSAVFSVARAVGLGATALFVVTDLVPIEGEWVLGFDDPRLAASDALLLPTLLAAMDAL